MPLFSVMLACALVCFVALTGGLLLAVVQRHLYLIVPWLITLAIGVLLRDAFLHLLPEALALTSSVEALFGWLLLGLALFFVLEQGLHWHHHTLPGATSELALQQFGWMSLAGDALHNLIDGALIAASFLVDPLVGWTTTLAVLLHELPQEISDTAILVAAGATLKRAIKLNLLSAASVFIGALLVLLLGNYFSLPLGVLLAITAGGFIYIALSDLLPLIKAPERGWQLIPQMAILCLGVLLIEGVHHLHLHSH